MGCFHSSSRGSSKIEGTTSVESAVNDGGRALKFSFHDLATATANFSDTIGQGGFGRVFKGQLDSGQIVAVKKLDQGGKQGKHEFLVEILMLTMLDHPNLVRLIGYCVHGNERLVVYEYMPNGSLEDHLYGLYSGQNNLEWNTRVKIALGVAKGLTYMHDDANPPIIFRDMKPANILLDGEFNPKLSDFGLAKVGPVGEMTHVSTRVMGTQGYCAPDYALSGKLNMKSDVYSFGVLLLELITGKVAYDSSNTRPERNLVTWLRPFLKDKRRCTQLADPLLQRRYPTKAFQNMITITSMCLEEQPRFRPIIRDVVLSLDFVASHPYISEAGPGING